MRLSFAAGLGLLLAFPLPARAQTQEAVLTAIRDATLYEGSGQTANGAGTGLFAGRTNEPQGSIRRALVLFDLSSIPSNARIESVTLTLTVTKSAAGLQPIGLHRVMASWGEGTSDAGGEEGQGAPATTNDATWTHRRWPNETWTEPGGDIALGASATTNAGGGATTWGSTNTLVTDVQGWLSAPATNHGWMLVGRESVARTALRFASRHSTTASERPTLRVRYRVGTATESPSAARLRLDAPYPSPARGVARVAFETPPGAACDLALFDALGRRALTLLDGACPAGLQAATWSAGPLAPGVYLLRLQAGAEVRTGRWVRR